MTSENIVSTRQLPASDAPDLTRWVRVGPSEQRRQRATALRSAKAALAARSLNCLLIGDSITAGFFATSLNKRLGDRFAATLRARLGLPAGGLGFLTPNPGAYPTGGTGYPVTVTGAATNALYGPCGRCAVLTPGNTAVYALPVGTTGADISVVGYTGAATLSYSVDGGADTTASTQRGTLKGGVVVAQIRGLAPGSAHTLTIGSTAGSVFLEGVMIYAGDETSGVRTITAGISGATTTSWRQVNAAQQLDVLGAYLPRLVAIELGINDYANGTVPVATARTNLQALITQIRGYYTAAGDPGPSFVLVGMHQRGGAGTVVEPWESYMQTFYALAEADSRQLVTVLNMQDAINPTPNPALGTVDTDLIHLTDTGHALIGDALADLMCA